MADTPAPAPTPLVEYHGLSVPAAWLTERPLYLAYLDDMTPLQRTAFQIARSHLKTSFELERSNGFVEWRAAKRAEEAMSTTEPR